MSIWPEYAGSCPSGPLHHGHLSFELELAYIFDSRALDNSIAWWHPIALQLFPMGMQASPCMARCRHHSNHFGGMLAVLKVLYDGMIFDTALAEPEPQLTNTLPVGLPHVSLSCCSLDQASTQVEAVPDGAP